MAEIKVPAPRKLHSGNYFIQIRRQEKSFSVTDPDEELCKAKAIALINGLIEKEKREANPTLTTAIDNYIECSPTPCPLLQSEDTEPFKAAGLKAPWDVK